ncbi:MAG: alpha/beta fold hydrolase [Sandaracinaceae bacterium]
MSIWTLLLLVALALVIVAVAATVAHVHYWSRKLRVELTYLTVERLPTPDGSAVELRRLPPGRGEGPPVLLVHGLALNHRNHDMLAELSLGRLLAERGRDVWLLTLRSGRGDVSLREGRGVTFDNMVRYDLPTGIDAVLERTGASALDYVGFSMGGMLMYAALGQTVPEGDVRRAAFIGSPARLTPPIPILAYARYVPRVLSPRVPLRLLSVFGAPFVGRLVTPWHHVLYNPANVDVRVAGLLLANGFVDIPGPLNADFAGWQGGHVSFDGRAVTENVEAATTPALFIAGAADRMAPPASVRLAYDHWGAAAAEEVEKAWRLLGVADGASGDYGHGDLAIGRGAAVDVFEPVATFLAP